MLDDDNGYADARQVRREIVQRDARVRRYATSGSMVLTGSVLWAVSSYAEQLPPSLPTVLSLVGIALAIWLVDTCLTWRNRAVYLRHAVLCGDSEDARAWCNHWTNPSVPDRWEV